MRGTQQPTTTVIVQQNRAEGPAYLPAHGRKRRRAQSVFAIQAFVGANGGGKSLAIMELCVVPAWEAGRLVVSNMGLYPEALGFPGDLYQPLTSWRDIVKMGKCQEKDPCEPGACSHSSTNGHGALLVLDEASAVLPSRGSSSVPHQLIRVMNQLRKRDVFCVWSAPAYQRMDLAVRETTQAVTVCTGLFPDVWKRDPTQRKLFPRKWRDPDTNEPVRFERAWAPRRLFSWVTYEAMSYDEFTLGKTAQLRPKARRSYWRTRHSAQLGYGTLEGVEMLDHVDASGACMECGFPKKSKKCEIDGCGKRPAPGGPPGPKAVGDLTAPTPQVRANGVRRLADRGPA